jgi:DnaJ family protein C protein 28
MWSLSIDRLLREAVEEGVFDNLPGRGEPLNLEQSPFEEPLAGTFARILRDNGATHPILEARRAIEAEVEDMRRQYLRDRRDDRFIERANALNREIRLFNVKSPLPNFHLDRIDAARELAQLRGR